MRTIALPLVAAAVLSAAAYAQNTERANPIDANPACMDRNIDSNSAGCLPRDDAARRPVADPRATTGVNATVPAGTYAAPGLQPAPGAPATGTTPVTNPTLPPVGNQPLANPTPTLTVPGSAAVPAAGAPSGTGK